MPTCAVEGCTSSSKKKFKMNSFPRNPVQRNLWVKSIGRSNWVPKDSSAVCEIHFAPEMWEKTRVDGTRKLKCNAVPTIFGNQTATKSINLHTMNTPEKNQTDINVLFPNNKQTIIKILPPGNQLNFQQTPLVIPTFSTTSTVNSKLLSTNTKSISILKPKIKMDKPKFTNGDQKRIIPISRNSLERKSSDLNPSLQINELNTSQAETKLNPASTGQIINLNGSLTVTNDSTVDVVKAADNQSVLFPMMVDTTNNLNCLKTQATDSIGNLPTTNRNAFNMTEAKISDRQLIPTTDDSVNSDLQEINSENHQQFKLKTSNMAVKITNVEKFNTKSTSPVSENLQSLNQQKSEGFVSSGIILNKTEAKKKEDERFEKMDNLLLKQLKLNDALRKKLIVLRRRVQSLMKSQEVNDDQKQDPGSTLFLKKAFTDDQIKVLQSRSSNPKSTITWSDETMMKAIKLKRACGLREYEEILNQNLPYPSFKTITRWCNARHIEIP